MNKSIKHIAVAAMSAAIVLPTLAWAGSDYDTVNKAIRIDAGTEAGSVESVNGSIRIGDGSTVKSVNSVNGAINIGDDVQVDHSVKAVNGAIELGQGSAVGGNVETVNGRIEMSSANVEGGVDTVNGGIRLLSGTIVGGDVTVHKPGGWNNSRNKPVKVEIGEDVQVYGNLVFEHPVELRIHDSASFGEVIGKEVTIVEL